MLDIELIRTQPDVIREAIRRRKREDYLGALDDLIATDKKWRDATTQVRDMRAKRNKVSDEIARMKGAEKEKAIAEMKILANEIKEKEVELTALEGKRNELLLLLPNSPHPDVVSGLTEEENKVVKFVGDKRDFGFKPKDHIDIAEKLGLIDIERAAKVSGARFYYLKGDLVHLEMALIKHALNTLDKNGFKLLVTPQLVRERALMGTGFLPAGREDLYKIEGDDLFLIGTSEVSMAAMHMDEVFEEEELPKYYGGFSSCFRTEAGAHGRDTKGIFRVHQFEKVEMFKFTHPSKSWDEHEHTIKVAEEFVSSLGLHYRVVDVCTGELGASAARKYDIEVWLPGQGKYRETASCSNCTDFQARRLNIRYRDRKENKLKFVHTLNSTTMATTRTIVAILENYQQEDGSVMIPKVLVPIMGKERIG
jgi:seryl-tRNA synthetase